MINPKSLENLKGFDKMDAARHKELSSKGGKARAQQRRDVKEQAEMIIAIMRYKEFFKTLNQLLSMDSDQLERLINKIDELK